MHGCTFLYYSELQLKYYLKKVYKLYNDEIKDICKETSSSGCRALFGKTHEKISFVHKSIGKHPYVFARVSHSYYNKMSPSTPIKIQFEQTLQ